MAYGLLLLRLVLGLTIAAHGAQKLFGSFGGQGLRGTASSFAALGFRAPQLMAVCAALAELGGGIFFASGLLTPLAAVAIAVVMLNAIATVHWPKGFWATAGGYEYNLVIWATCVAVVTSGPGRLSLDAAIGWDDDISGLWWGVAVLVASALVSVVTLTWGRRRGGTSVEAKAADSSSDIRSSRSRTQPNA